MSKAQRITITMTIQTINTVNEVLFKMGLLLIKQGDNKMADLIFEINDQLKTIPLELAKYFDQEDI